MAVPKYRTSSSKRNMRRSHHALKPPRGVSLCPDCGEIKYSHSVCDSCGKYKGQTIFEPKQSSWESSEFQPEKK